MTPDLLTDTPILLYLLLGVMTIAKVSEYFPGILGGFSRGISERAEAKRRAASASDDADIAELKRQITELEQARQRDRAVLDRIRESQVQHEQVLLVHDAWDRAVMVDPSHAQRVPRPPLYPVRDDTA